jgi:hypothetical protein
VDGNRCLDTYRFAVIGSGGKDEPCDVFFCDNVDKLYPSASLQRESEVHLVRLELTT